MSDEIKPTLIDAIDFALQRVSTEEATNDTMNCYNRLQEALYWAGIHRERVEYEENCKVKLKLLKNKQEEKLDPGTKT